MKENSVSAERFWPNNEEAINKKMQTNMKVENNFGITEIYKEQEENTARKSNLYFVLFFS